MASKGTWHKIMHSPLTRIIVGVIIISLIAGGSQYLLNEWLEKTSLSQDIRHLVVGIIAAILAILTYVYLYKFYERRKIDELSIKGNWSYLAIGVALGATLQALTILVIFLMGGYSIVSINKFAYVIPALTMAFSAAIIEEILLRGVIFRIVEKSLGTYIGLLISAVIFGLMHLGNPNSSLVLAIGIAIEAGILLGAAYIYTRNLWFPIAIHFAWNFTQSGIFGASTSGIPVSKSLITANIQGAEWYTGGQFGPEGAIQATIFCLIAAIVLMVLNHRQNKLINPFWVKTRIATRPLTRS